VELPGDAQRHAGLLQLARGSGVRKQRLPGGVAFLVETLLAANQDSLDAGIAILSGAPARVRRCTV